MAKILKTFLLKGQPSVTSNDINRYMQINTRFIKNLKDIKYSPE